MKSSFEDGTDNSKHRYDPSRIQNSSFRILWTIKIFESFEQLATDHVTDTDGDNDNEKRWQRPCYRNKQQWNDEIMLQNIKLVIRLNNQMGKNMPLIWIYHCSRWKASSFRKNGNFWHEFRKKYLADLVKISSSWKLKFKKRFVKINMGECNQIKWG